MFNTDRHDVVVNVPAREWQTYYDPKDVGEFLDDFYSRYTPESLTDEELGQLIKNEPGAIYMPPPISSTPSLNEFLRWCAKNKRGVKPS